MQFVIIGTDAKDATELRAATRSDHLDYWKGQGKIFLAAGPFLNPEEKPTGSMIIIETSDLPNAQNLAQNDPYNLKGVFQSHTVQRWNWLFGKPEDK